MSAFLYKTIANERPQGKPNVYFACHPADREKYFEEYAQKILKIQDCAVWYESKPEEAYDEEDLQLRLAQMQLFVMPVTTKLLTAPNRAMDVEFPFALQQHIPVLPLMMEQGLDDVFSRRFGDLQYLDPNNTDGTKRSFDEVLSAYIRSTLVSDELAKKVRAAFDAYIFLSYRKKDRKMAQDLMRLIHQNPLCRDIAIWYDEFLTPGEDFNQAIEEMLGKSDLFALAVTPNLVNEPNYVMTTEYPAALAQKKPVLPVEMAQTDRSALKEHYEALPPVVQAEDGESLREALLEKLKVLAITANDADPQHNFLIGLAYLDGIDVEVNSSRALELISGAAEAGVPEAMQQLVAMYETGKGVARDYRQGIEWRRNYVSVLREDFKKDSEGKTVDLLLHALLELGDAQFNISCLDEAKMAYDEMQSIAARLMDNGDVRYRRDLATSFDKLGNVAKAKGQMSEAREHYEKSLTIREQIAKEDESNSSCREFAVSYDELGSLAMTMGKRIEAKRYYEKGLSIRERLAENMQTVEALNDLAVSYCNLGDAQKSWGILGEAQMYYQKALDIDMKLAEETGTEQSRRNLALTYYKMGKVMMARQIWSYTREYYEKGFAISKKLAEETGTIKSRRLLAFYYNGLGIIAEEQKDLSRAQDYYEKSLTLRKELAEETGTIGCRRDLSVGYNNLGLFIEVHGDLSVAELYYEKHLAICEELAKEDGSARSRQDLASCYEYLGDKAWTRNDVETAETYFKDCLEVRKKLAKDTDMLEYRHDLGRIFGKLAEVAKAKG
ncbi:MAG: tetratricopeptide repeat protein, partial [Firmicutes bacterium]|nr:tetratricopeptide repeat protein [Bacillota bacterium]